MGASPTPADSTHCLRGQNKSSLKTSCKHMPNPRPRLHEVSYCGPWVITLQLGFSTAVTSRLVAGQLSLLAESTCGMQDQGSPAHALPTWSLPSFPVTSFLPSHLQHLKPLPFLNLNSTWVINSSIRMIKKGMGGMREVILPSTELQTIRKMILIPCLRTVLELPEDFSFVLLYSLYLPHFQIWEI